MKEEEASRHVVGGGVAWWDDTIITAAIVACRLEIGGAVEGLPINRLFTIGGLIGLQRVIYSL